MKFRDPEAKKLNALRLMPLPFLALALSFTAYSIYQHQIGADESMFWVAVGGAASVYFLLRSWFAVRSVFEFGDDVRTED